MRYTRPLSVIVLALLVSLLNASLSKANVDTDRSGYRVRARVARVSLLRGDVQLRRAGSREWESATVNLPLVEGDQLATGRDARLEIQIDAYNFVRVAEDSLLTIVTLRDEGIALSLAEGTATVRLARFESDREYFEVDAPKTTVAAEKRGLYRLDAVRGENNQSDVRITVRDGGRARIYSESSGFTLRDGRTARLFLDGTEAGDWELTSASALDTWDEWVDEREDYLAKRLNYERRDHFYRNSLWGAEELDAYGDWTYADSYGWVWRPRVTVINNYYNWAPYRFGHWRWCPPYGWVWVGDEPWGWAPYHYGRWVFYSGSWCWTPYGYYDYSRRLNYYHYWQPALVVFVHIPSYYQVCWYPLPYHAPDPVYTGPVPQPGNGGVLVETAKSGGKLVETSKGSVRPTDKAYLNAVTSMPVKDFGATNLSGKPAPPALSQTVIQSEPVALNSLPVRTPKTGAGPAANVNETTPVRPPRGQGGLVSPLTDRPTGAATRKPGVALDRELRESRLYNGREPVSRPKSDNGGTIKNSGEVKDTGAVARPSRPVGRSNTDRPLVRSDENNAPPSRPTRPEATIREDDSSSNGQESLPVRPSRRPERSPEISQPPSPPQPMPDRPVRQPRQEPVRPQPEPVRPAPMPDRPQRSEPPPRYDPPPQKSEPPPQREAPPPPPPPPPAKAPDAPVNNGKGGRGSISN